MFFKGPPGVGYGFDKVLVFKGVSRDLGVVEGRDAGIPGAML